MALWCLKAVWRLMKCVINCKWANQVWVLALRNCRNLILLNNNLREEAANNILSPRKTFSSFSETFSLKISAWNWHQCRSSKRCSSYYQSITWKQWFNWSWNTRGAKIKAQLDHTHVYYEWLEQLTEAIESGEIFKYFPIPEQPSDTEN